MSQQMESKRKMTRREMLKLTAASGVGLLAASCAPATTAPAPAAPSGATTAPAAPAPTTAPAAAAAKAKLRLVVMDYDEKMKPDTQALVDAWNKQSTTSEVELNVYAWGQGHDLLLTQISGGQAPDLANGNAQWQGEWVGIDEVLPVGDLLPKDFLANFQPSALQAFTLDGKQYGMPYFLDPRAMYYRKDLFDAAGLQAPTTWDGVVQAGTKLHTPGDVSGYGLSFSRKSDDMDYFWYAFLGANGADGNNKLWDENKKSRLGSDQAIAGVQWLADLFQKNKITNPDIIGSGRDDALQPLFYAGKMAMLQTGSWFPTLLKNNAPDLKYAISTIPVAKEGMKPVTAFWPDCVMLFKQTKNQAAALEFLQWMFNKENRLTFAKQRGVIPERIDVGSDPAYASGETEKYFVEQLKTAVSAYDSPFPANLYDNYTVANTACGRAVIGELPVADALKQAAVDIDKKNGVA